MKEDRISYKSFEIMWKKKSRSYGHLLLITHHSKLLITYISICVEWIFTKHLVEQGLSMEDIIDLGIEDTMHKAMKSITNKDMITSLLYTYSNTPYTLDKTLKKDALDTAVKLFKTFSTDAEIVKQEILSIYENKKEQAERIFFRCPENVIMEYLNKLNYKKFVVEHKDIKNIRKILLNKLDDLIVFDMKANHEAYLEYCNNCNREATIEVFEEIRKGVLA